MTYRGVDGTGDVVSMDVFGHAHAVKSKQRRCLNLCRR